MVQPASTSSPSFFPLSFGTERSGIAHMNYAWSRPLAYLLLFPNPVMDQGINQSNQGQNPRVYHANLAPFDIISAEAGMSREVLESA